jgi:hypothetical protein
MRQGALILGFSLMSPRYDAGNHKIGAPADKLSHTTFDTFSLLTTGGSSDA